VVSVFDYANESCCWSSGAITLHQITQNLGAGGRIFLVQVALLIVSNYAFERMVGTHGRDVFRPPLNSRPLDGLCNLNLVVGFIKE
jgi:hypothetical protein